MALEFLAKSANGREVFYDNETSHAALHFDDTPGLNALAAEAIEKMTLEGKDIGTQLDLGRVVGQTDIAETEPGDEIIYAERRGRPRDGLVPFVKNKQGPDSSSVAIHVVQQPDGNYLLSSAWIGEYDGDDEPFPSEVNATERSIPYWESHAFVYGSQGIVPGTETAQKPW